MALIFSLGGLIVWYVGGRDVLAGKMTLGSLMAFLAYLAMFYAPLATLSQFTTWLTSFLTGCQRVFELLDTPVEATRPGRARIDLPTGRAARSASRTSPSATSGTSPCSRTSTSRFEPGEKIGIVGRSGSGKTTLVNLHLPLLRRRRGPRAARRRRRPRSWPPADLRAQRRRRAAGAVPVPRHDLGQPRLRPARRRRRRGDRRRPARPRPTTSSSARRSATTPGSANAAPASPAANGSGSRSPGRCSTIRRS